MSFKLNKNLSTEKLNGYYRMKVMKLRYNLPIKDSNLSLNQKQQCAYDKTLKNDPNKKSGTADEISRNSLLIN